MSDAEFSHFVSAQDDVIEDVERELRAGRKQSHWMWFIFPQLEGLGHSPMAIRYGIRDLAAARCYREDPVLGGRLRRHVGMMLVHAGRSAREILGPPDDLKFRSCLTLFLLASDMPEDRALFDNVLGAFYAGVQDDMTRTLIGR